jgi:hypothetical protein
VLDDRGQPVVGALAQAWPRVFHAGRPWFNWIAAANARTDDEGHYRLTELAPGDYVICVPAIGATVPPDAARLANHYQPDLNWLRMVAAPWTGQDLVNPPALSAHAVSVGQWWSLLVGRPAAAPVGGAPHHYVTTFHPGVQVLGSARAIHVDGSEVAGIDVPLTRAPSRRVAGRVASREGAAAYVGMYLTRTDAFTAGAAPSGFAVSDASGEFLFDGVEGGTYMLTATVLPVHGGPMRARPPAAADSVTTLYWPTQPWSESPTLWAEQPLTVGDEDIDGVLVELRPGARVTGRVRFEGSSPTPSTVALNRVLELEPADGRPRSIGVYGEIGVNDRGEFRSIGVPPGRYFIRASRTPLPWTIQSAMHDGVDRSLVQLDLNQSDVSGVVVTLRDHTSQLSGVVSRGGHPDPDASVAAIPVDRALWTDYGARPRHLVNVRVQPDGRYVLRGLPAGAYLVVAVPDVSMRHWHDAELFERLASVAQRIELRDAEQRTLNLVTQEWR